MKTQLQAHTKEIPPIEVSTSIGTGAVLLVVSLEQAALFLGGARDL